MSVIEYKLKFEEVVLECGFHIRHLSTIYMFYNGLRLDFKRELILHVMKSVKVTFLFCFRVRIVHFQNQRDVLRVSNMDTMLTSAPIKCSKCGEFGHYDYQCP